MMWFKQLSKWFTTAQLSAVYRGYLVKERKMAKATKKPLFAWGFEFTDGSYYSEFFGTKTSAKEFANTALNDDCKIVKFSFKKYSAK